MDAPITPDSTTANTAAAEVSIANKLPPISIHEKIAMAEYLLRHWTGNNETLENAIDAAGLEDAPADTRSDAAMAYDMMLGGTTPEAYDLKGLYLGRHAILGVDIPELDAGLREALSAMEIPSVMGRSIADELLNSTGASWHMQTSPADKESFYQQQCQTVAKVMHMSYEQAIELAKVAVSRIPRETANMLAKAGAFDRAAVLVQLARQGERLQARAAMQ